MSNAALQSEILYQAPSPRLSLAPSNDDTRGISRRIILLGAILITLQIMDGLLTATGVHTYGVSVEGNPLLRQSMEIFGTIPALIVTKLICVCLVIGLCFQAARVRWVSMALHGVAALYAVCAVIPWSIILFTEYFWYIG